MVVQEALPDQPDALPRACRRDALVGKGFGQPVLCQPGNRRETLPWSFAADAFRGWASVESSARALPSSTLLTYCSGDAEEFASEKDTSGANDEEVLTILLL